MASSRIRRQLRQLFRLVRRLDGAGVSENLILAVVFFALSRDDRGTLAAFWQDDGSGEDDGSGDEDD
ncbi:hypothetical protein [Symbiobacterium thermophilum]|uniref:Uncharacterized protein n=2 Tax=Symbiobacterium thermophilum TaxID=2734 RepID=Q67PI0_SYMTH|nr:hypothetical protein [Symbiobacterium thermophilum]MBY6275961.1 hypothetical protein [Symbiobacterium thermophilum]OTA40535.1 MAG: hypothetical protein A6D92_16125 [Symbiobacterium thermophilum]BAD40413.1 hypothetical protein STH1428 [Symbiobacterium thermophilum IAM 14863]